MTQTDYAKLVLLMRDVSQSLPTTDPLKKQAVSLLRKLRHKCDVDFAYIGRNTTVEELPRLRSGGV